MNSFSVTYARYVVTAPSAGQQNNPVVAIRGTINGRDAWYYPYWNLVQSANIFGGFALVQQLIAAGFMAFSNDVRLVPVGQPLFPTFPSAQSIPAPSGVETNGYADCVAALVSSWSA